MARITSKKMGVTNGNGYTLTIKAKEGIKDMTREHFENNTSWKMTYEEFQKCNCTQCNKDNCVHRESFRRMPVIDGGLGLYPNLKES